METVIHAKTLRTRLAEIMKRVQKGERFTVLYRSRPVCRITPADRVLEAESALEEDPIYQSESLSCSKDGKTAADHDEILYGGRGR